MSDDSPTSKLALWWDDTKGFIARRLGIEVAKDCTEAFALAITSDLDELSESLLHATELVRIASRGLDRQPIRAEWDNSDRESMPIVLAQEALVEAARSDLTLASEAPTRSCVFCLAITREPWPELLCRTYMSDSRFKGRLFWERGFHTEDGETAFLFDCGNLSDSVSLWE